MLPRGGCTGVSYNPDSPRNDRCGWKRNISICRIANLLSSRGRSPWRSTVLQYTNRLTGSSPPRHDGLPRLSLRSLLAMTNVFVLYSNRTLIPFPTSVIARAESPWRSTVLQYTNRLTGSSPPRHDGLPRLSLRSLLAMTKNVL